MPVALLALALLLGDAAPSTQTLIYYNARMALREGAPTEALKLWLLRNAVEAETHEVSPHDADLHSVTWAALGALGLCPDGFPEDRGGAGLFPLAQHNVLARAIRRADPASLGSAFDAFEYGRQQRHVSLRDVLDADELRAVQFERTPCWLHATLLWEMLEDFGAELTDREVTGRLLRHLLRHSLKTLDPKAVRGRSVVKARIFDLNLRLGDLASRKARRARRAAQIDRRRQGLSAVEIAEDDKAPLVPPDSEAGRVLADATTWSAGEWMALASDRRQALFAEVMRLDGAAERVAPVVVEVIDALIEARSGRELQTWLAYLGDAPARRRLAWSGARGRRLLALDLETGFRERAAIALHRGVDFLAEGDREAALRSFALALGWAETSAQADEIRNLSRRWLSFVAAQYRVTDALFTMLKTVVPRADYAAVLEDQLWTAAFAADAESFERCVRHRMGQGAMNQRVEALAPLARGDAGAFVDGVAAQLRDAPSSAMRYIALFLERLQGQDAETRARLAPTLRRLGALLEAEEGPDAPKRNRRRAEALVDAIQGLLEGMPAATIDPERAMAVDRAVFAGSVRVAPSDPLPWPFRVAEAEPPSAFEPIALRPVEWRDEAGEWVYGWQVSE